MANVPLSPEACEALADAAERRAKDIRRYVASGEQVDGNVREMLPGAKLLDDSAALLRGAAANDRRPVVPEDHRPARTGPPPAQVDTFPADHPSRKPSAVVAGHQEAQAIPAASNLGVDLEPVNVCPHGTAPVACVVCKGEVPKKAARSKAHGGNLDVREADYNPGEAGLNLGEQA